MQAPAGEHQPVLLHAALEALAVRPHGSYVDATYGRGGHSAAILDRLDERGRLYALDTDPEAVAAAEARWRGEPRFTIWHARFSRLRELLDEHGVCGALDGILLDLGVSSPQLDDPARGFSFRADGPLDMRMNPAEGSPVADWLATVAESELAAVISRFGEERYARRIARAVVRARERAPLRRSLQLAELCTAAVPRREPGKHPATRTFQALRIFVNGELDELQATLPGAAACLAPGGRLAVISFHSLEDRLVKRFLRGPAVPRHPRRLPPPPDAQPRLLRPLGKARRATAGEVAANPRARSAVLRVAERLP